MAKIAVIGMGIILLLLCFYLPSVLVSFGGEFYGTLTLVFLIFFSFSAIVYGAVSK